MRLAPSNIGNDEVKRAPNDLFVPLPMTSVPKFILSFIIVRKNISRKISSIILSLYRASEGLPNVNCAWAGNLLFEFCNSDLNVWLEANPKGNIAAREHSLFSSYFISLFLVFISISWWLISALTVSKSMRVQFVSVFHRATFSKRAKRTNGRPIDGTMCKQRAWSRMKYHKFHIF